MAIITGKSTNDSLLGSGKDDTIDGYGGNDTIRGGAGNDLITGGTGNDILIFESTRALNGFDTITDYSWWNSEAGTGDRLNLAALTAYTSKSVLSNFVNFVWVGHDLMMYVDPDGTGTKYGSEAWAKFQNIEEGGNMRLVIGSITVDVAIPANNHPPAITSNGAGASASVSLAENTSAVTTVTATDADADSLTYSISGGVDASRFTINATTGALSFITAPNYEAPTDSGSDNVYNVVVQVSDGLATDTQAIAVTINNVAEAPVITSNGGGASAAVSVAENGTAVTTVTATDQDASTTLAYTIVGGADSSLFTIGGSTGVLSFNTAPNYEAPSDSGPNNVYDVTVQVSDGTLTDTQAIAVTVTNVNEAPEITSGSGATAAVTITENTSAVTTVTATDVDAGTTLTYSISGGADSSLFTINSSTGALSFNSAPDYESPFNSNTDNVYDVTVQVSDGTLTDTQAIAVTVTNALPTAVADNVIYGMNNSNDITIPRWALLVNDVDSDNPSDPWYNVISNSWAISSVTGTGATLTGGNVAYGGLSAGGSGSFTYALTGSAAATVTTARVVTEATLAGTSGNDVLVGGRSTAYTFTGGNGNDVMVGNGGADAMTGGEGTDVYYGGDGIDALTLTETTAVTDYVRLDTVTAATDRDTIAGFTVGSGGTRDIALLADANTTNATSGVQIATITAGAAVTLSSASGDIFKLAFDAGADADLGAGTQFTTGTQLLDAMDTAAGSAAVTVVANDKGYILAYDGGDAFLYYFANNGNTSLAANEISLIGVFTGVAVDSLVASNFVLV